MVSSPANDKGAIWRNPGVRVAFLSENIHGVYMLLVTAKATVPSRPCYSGLKFSRVTWVCASARNSRANKPAAIGRSLKKIL
jgi:hypothetical protein